ncbi:MAG TPA: DUF4349 domain-containing protein [Chloroflexi bacterium]|nr:MAG: hypothetical protein B6243_13430 [Anaerolineaceae bacterium 4572_5.2]HEY84162.1 DUF4349 domain-containing protein [Chloroflexota bacterium]
MNDSARKLFGKKIMALVLLVVLSMATACGASQQSADMTMESPAMEAPQATMQKSAYNADMTVDESAAQDAIPLDQPRLIVYTGNIDLVVKDTRQTIETITKMAKEAGGYVAGANMYTYNGAPQGSMTIKIPAESYQEVLQQLRALAIRVEGETSSTQDVTEEFVDLEARKANLEVTEQALQELLTTRQKTGRTEDILEVHRELTNIRGQIEQIQGRLNYLARSAAMSTIEIALTPDELAQPLAVAGWEPSGTAREALRSLISAFQGFVDFWIWIIIFVLPVAFAWLLPPIIVIWLFVRWLRARRARKKEANAQTVDKSEAPAVEKEE